MSLVAKLEQLRRHGGAARTKGLSDAVVERLGSKYPELGEAIDAAVELHAQLRKEFPELLALEESEQLARVQADFVNFYPEDGG